MEALEVHYVIPFLSSEVDVPPHRREAGQRGAMIRQKRAQRQWRLGREEKESGARMMMDGKCQEWKGRQVGRAWVEAR